MLYKFAKIFCSIILLLYSQNNLLDDSKVSSSLPQLPPIETTFLEPIELENVSVWVIADKTVPFINRSCRLRDNCSYSCVLPANVYHSKTDSCPAEVARLLAEYTSTYHGQALPLTIFNGWQWEYSYSLCQFESLTYNLAPRGGCWENCWEAVMTLRRSSNKLKWLNAKSMQQFDTRQLNIQPESVLEVKMFSSVRIRDGYPKERQF